MRTRAAALAALALALGGCPAADPCAAEPSYGGLGNDEVWLTLKDAKANATHDGDFPTVTSPAADATVPAASAPTFSWESPLKIALGGPKGPQPLYRARRSIIDDVRELVIPSAHAHLAPVSSDAYLVDVLVPGRECPVSIVTTELSHVLDPDSWNILKEAAGQPLTLQLTSAYLANGRVTEGPFKADDVTFTVE